MFIRAFFALSVATMLAGCSMVDGAITARVDTINQSTEDALNNAILTNIVRASLFRPLNFIAISKVSGSQFIDAKNGLPTITLGPGQTPLQHQLVFGSNLIDNQASANFDIALLNSKDFYKGILTPLSVVDVNLLVQQGYERGLLFKLFVDSIIVRRGDTPAEAAKAAAEIYTNDPGRPENLRVFNEFVEDQVAKGVSTEARDQCNPKFDPNDKTNAAGARTMPVGRVCYDPALTAKPNETYRLYASDPASRTMLCGTEWVKEAVNTTAEQKREVKDAPTDAAPNKRTITKTTTTSSACSMPKPVRQRDARGWVQNNTGRLVASDDDSEYTIKGVSPSPSYTAKSNDGNKKYFEAIIKPRSTYAIFIFLGSLLRENDTSKDQAINVSLPEVIRGQSRDCFSHITYDRSDYCVPSERAENTKQVFGILTQLLALKTSPGDLPITPTVRVAP